MKSHRSKSKARDSRYPVRQMVSQDTSDTRNKTKLEVDRRASTTNKKVEPIKRVGKGRRWEREKRKKESGLWTGYCSIIGPPGSF